jgi:uncharacterized protein (DUF58 family)
MTIQFKTKTPNPTKRVSGSAVLREPQPSPHWNPIGHSQFRGPHPPAPIKPFRITREGKWFLLLWFGVGVAAFNSGNNLLYLIVAFMGCLFLFQIIFEEFNLKHLMLRRTAPDRAVANEPFWVTLHITNRNSRLPVFSIQIRDLIDGRPFKRSGHFLRASAGETRHIEYRCELPGRGLSHFEGILLSTAFPFGLTERRRLIPVPHDVIVWPEKIPVHLPRQYSRLSNGAFVSPRRGVSDDFWQLRNYQTGDDARKISWKASARQDRLIMQDNAAQSDQRVHLVLEFDPTMKANVNEQLIRIAASLSNLLFRRHIQVILITAETVVMQCLPSTCTQLLDHLALIDPYVIPARQNAALPSDAIIINSNNASVFIRHADSEDRKPQSTERTPARASSIREGKSVAP